MKFRVTVNVRRVRGTQVFEVEAPTKDEAKAAVMRGEGEQVDECIEVESLDWTTAKASQLE